MVSELTLGCCKLIDFGGWANETHRIAGEEALDEIGSEDERRMKQLEQILG